MSKRARKVLDQDHQEVNHLKIKTRKQGTNQDPPNVEVGRNLKLVVLKRVVGVSYYTDYYYYYR
jgi:hypothetical protein